VSQISIISRFPNDDLHSSNSEIQRLPYANRECLTKMFFSNNAKPFTNKQPTGIKKFQSNTHVETISLLPLIHNQWRLARRHCSTPILTQYFVFRSVYCFILIFSFASTRHVENVSSLRKTFGTRLNIRHQLMKLLLQKAKKSKVGQKPVMLTLIIRAIGNH